MKLQESSQQNTKVEARPGFTDVLAFGAVADKAALDAFIKVD